MYWFLLLSFIIAEQQVLTDFHRTGSWALARTCCWPQNIHWKRCTHKNGRTSWLPISPPYPVTHAWTLSWYSKGSVSAPVLNNRKKKESGLTPMSAERKKNTSFPRKIYDDIKDRFCNEIILQLSFAAQCKLYFRQLFWGKKSNNTMAP